MENMKLSLIDSELMIIRTPNEMASKYVIFRNDHEHINFKNSYSLKTLLDMYFKNSFIFSMNDKVVYLGYYPMVYYLFGVGVGKKRALK
jgi:hypothetical protein